MLRGKVIQPKHRQTIKPDSYFIQRVFVYKLILEVKDHRCQNKNELRSGMIYKAHLFLGWTSLLDFDKREDILATMLLHELIWKRQTAIDQLIVGLGILNVIDLIKRYPELFKDKLVHSPNIVSKERLLEEMYIVRPTTEDEERTATFFDNYLGTDGQLEIAGFPLTNFIGTGHNFKGLDWVS